MKDSVLNLLRVTGAFAPFRWTNRHNALIVTYHRFSESDGGKTKISARSFAEQVKYLREHYRLVPLSKLADCLRGPELPSRLAAITIDDGYRDFYDIAFPILRKYNATATVFIVTKFVDGVSWLWTDMSRYLTGMAAPRTYSIRIGERDLKLELNGGESRAAAATKINAELKRLPDESREESLKRLAIELKTSLPERPLEEYSAFNWDQAREMASAGIEIGSHTLTHPILTHISDEKLRDEISGSRERIQSALQMEVDTFCYPNGDYDARARGAVARAGYRVAVTTEVGLNDGSKDPLTLRRIHGEHDLARFVKNTSGLALAL